MRIAFFGTPDFALPALQALQEAEDMEVVLVVSQPDRKRSRGKCTPTPVKAAALQWELPVLTPESVNSPSVREELEKADPAFLVVIAYGQKIGSALLDAYAGRIVNIHGSLLPHYRGAAPIQRALLNGEETMGVSAMLINETMDGGDVLATASLTTGDSDLTEITERLSRLGATLLLDTLRHYKERFDARIPQDDSHATYAEKIKKTDGQLDFSQSAKALLRRIRTVKDWPGAKLLLDGETYKIHKAHAAQADKKGRIGEIMQADKNGIAIQTGDGLLVVDEIQAPNKKAMATEAFLNGHTIPVGTCITPWDTEARK